MKKFDLPVSDILEHYGYAHQVRKALEECEELRVEVERAFLYTRGGAPLGNHLRAAIVTECADVLIMSAQLLRIEEFPVDMEKDEALNRLFFECLREIIGAKRLLNAWPKFRLYGLAYLAEAAAQLAVAVAPFETVQAEIDRKINRQRGRILAEEAEKAPDIPKRWRNVSEETPPVFAACQFERKDGTGFPGYFEPFGDVVPERPRLPRVKLSEIARFKILRKKGDL